MVLVGTRCVDKVIVAEIVNSGSQVMTKFDQIFYHILIDLIFYFFVLRFCDRSEHLDRSEHNPVLDPRLYI